MHPQPNENTPEPAVSEENRNSDGPFWGSYIGGDRRRPGQPSTPGTHEDCSCKEPYDPRSPRRPCTRTKAPKDDCCEQILSILMGLSDEKGKDGRKPRLKKKKTPPKVKLANWCCDWPVPDIFLPLFVLMYTRYRKEVPVRNDFEKRIYEVFARFTPEQTRAVERVVNLYKDLPDCGLDRRLDDWSNDRPLDPRVIQIGAVFEALMMGAWATLGYNDDKPRAGRVRLWEQAFMTGQDGSFSKKLTAPWPWVSAVNPGADGKTWFKNRDYIANTNWDFNALNFETYEWDMTCSFTAQPQGGSNNSQKLSKTCVDNVVLSGFGGCPAGALYSVNQFNKNRCLRVAPVIAGQDLVLRGFNFSSMNCTVELERLDGPFPKQALKSTTLGSDKPDSAPANAAIGDMLVVTIPLNYEDPMGQQIPLVPGRYVLRVIVPNVTNYAPEPGPAPASFTSNDVNINIYPQIDVNYELTFEKVRCYEETSGPGSDDPWFRAYTATFTGSNLGQQLVVGAMDILREDGVDAGDSFDINAQAFSGRFEPGGAMAVAVLGLEVDDEDLATKEAVSFGEAFEAFYKTAWAGMGNSASGSLLVDGLKVLGAGGGLNTTLVLGGAGLIAVAVTGLIYASWAAADPVAYDVISFDQQAMYQLTVPGVGFRAPSSGRIGDIDWSSIPLGTTPTSVFVGEYREERQYYSDDEESRYGLSFRVKR